MMTTLRTFALVFQLLLVPALSAMAAPPDAGALINRAVRRFEALNDYTCVLTREELIGDKLVRQENIIYKFRKPFSVYMKWTTGKEKGIEVIYPKPGRQDRLVAHLGKFNIINFTLDPSGRLATKNSRHSILESPMGYLLTRVKENYELSKKRGEGRVSYDGEEVVDGRRTYLFSGEFPEDTGYYGSRVLLNFYEDTTLPARVAVYGKDGRLLEKYEYSRLQIDVGLSSVDFDPENPAYNF